MNEIVPKGIKQRPYKEALNWFFYRDRKIPLSEKFSIKKIEVLEEDRIFACFGENQTEMFKNLKYLADLFMFLKFYFIFLS